MGSMSYEEYIQSVVADAPPLTPEQRDRIASIIRYQEPVELTSASDGFESLREAVGDE